MRICQCQCQCQCLPVCQCQCQCHEIHDIAVCLVCPRPSTKIPIHGNHGMASQLSPSPQPHYTERPIMTGLLCGNNRTGSPTPFGVGEIVSGLLMDYENTKKKIILMSNKDFHLHQGINFDQLINILAIYHIFDDDVIALRPLFLSCISCIGSSIYYLWHRLACLCNSFVTLCQGVGVRRMSHNTEDTAQSVAYWYIIKKECSITFYWIAFRKAMLVKSSTLSFDS